MQGRGNNKNNRSAPSMSEATKRRRAEISSSMSKIKIEWKIFFLGLRQFILAVIILFGILVFPAIGLQALLQINEGMAYSLAIIGPHSLLSWLFLLVDVFWFPIFLAMWVTRDAIKFKRQGINTMPFLWAIGMVLPTIIAVFPFYFVFRSISWQRKFSKNNPNTIEQEEQQENVEKRLGFIKKGHEFLLNVIAATFVIYIAYVVYTVTISPNLSSTKQKTDEQVAKIHATKLTLDDVMGKNLPPDPGEAANATIEGIDANQNGIRDDVELAIFKEYPNSARTRAAALQYAMALQIGLTQIFNSDTLVAMAQEKSRAYGCLFDSVGGGRIIIQHTDSLEKIILNTDARDNKLEEMYDKYMVSHGNVEGKPDCDIDPASLPN